MISWERVNELRDEVGPDDFDEVVEIFLEEVAEVMERLRGDPPVDTLESELHFLKGSALNLGFQSLGDLCTSGERMAAGGQFDGIDLAAVAKTYDSSMQQFNSGLSDLRSAA